MTTISDFLAGMAVENVQNQKKNQQIWSQKWQLWSHRNNLQGVCGVQIHIPGGRRRVQHPPPQPKVPTNP